MFSSATARESAASEGSSATQGAHQVAQRFNTTPRPRYAASPCGFPAASTKRIGGIAAGGVSRCSPSSPAAARARGLRAISPAATVAPARNPLRVMKLMPDRLR